MITNHTKESLIQFEDSVCEAFMNKEIKAPVHLYSNNEEKMLEIFGDVKFLTKVASGSGTVVEHSTHDRKITSSNPVAGIERELMASG
jgi:hypothetical protein